MFNWKLQWSSGTRLASGFSERINDMAAVEPELVGEVHRISRYKQARKIILVSMWWTKSGEQYEIDEAATKIGTAKREQHS